MMALADADNQYPRSGSHHVSNDRWLGLSHPEAKKVAYNPDAVDADNDQIVQEGTPYARPRQRQRQAGADEPYVPRSTPNVPDSVTPLPHQRAPDSIPIEKPFPLVVYPRAQVLTNGRKRYLTEHPQYDDGEMRDSYDDVLADPDTQRVISAAYMDLPTFDHSPEVDAAYSQFRREVDEQYDFLVNEMGIKHEVVGYDPYKTVDEMIADVRDNGHLFTLATAATGSHVDVSDAENDKLRAVHDAFGHAASGRGFDRHGEEAAYQSHAAMFSALAQRAVATEFRGQNATLIVNGERAPQKHALMPPEMAAIDYQATVPQPEKKSVWLTRQHTRYDPNARDADNDRIVQEGTPFARPKQPGLWVNPFSHGPEHHGHHGQAPEDTRPPPKPKTPKQHKAEKDARNAIVEWVAAHPGGGMAAYYDANPYGSSTGDAEYDDAFNAEITAYDREVHQRGTPANGFLPRTPLAVMSQGSDQPAEPYTWQDRERDEKIAADPARSAEERHAARARADAYGQGSAAVLATPKVEAAPARAPKAPRATTDADIFTGVDAMAHNRDVSQRANEEAYGLRAQTKTEVINALAKRMAPSVGKVADQPLDFGNPKNRGAITQAVLDREWLPDVNPDATSTDWSRTWRDVAGPDATDEDVARLFASLFVQSWADSAADHKPMSLAVQREAGVKFHTPPVLVHPSVADDTDAITAALGPTIDSYLDATYSLTQEALAKAGVKQVTVARMSDASELDAEGDQLVATNPLSSWASRIEVTRQFTALHERPRLITATVPASRVFSTAFSGPGALLEQEVILTGTDHLTVTPTPWDTLSSEWPPVATKAAKAKGKAVFIDTPGLAGEDWPKRTNDVMSRAAIRKILKGGKEAKAVPMDLDHDHYGEAPTGLWLPWDAMPPINLGDEVKAGGPDRSRGNAETLRRYWTHGEGAVKIRWGEPGDFKRCVRAVERHMPGRAEGYCANRHKEALGVWPGREHAGKKVMDVFTDDDPVYPWDEDGNAYDENHVDVQDILLAEDAAMKGWLEDHGPTETKAINVGTIFDVAGWGRRLAKDVEGWFASLYGDFGKRQQAKTRADFAVATQGGDRPLDLTPDPNEVGIESVPFHDFNIALPQVQTAIVEQVNRVVGVNDVLYARITDTLAEGEARGETMPELAARVDQVFATSKARAMAIARTEVTAAANSAQLEAARLNGAKTKTWIAAHDDRTRESHVLIDRTTVDIDDHYPVPLVVKGAPAGIVPMEYPGDPAAPPSLTVNCRCTQAYGFGLNYPGAVESPAWFAAHEQTP